MSEQGERPPRLRPLDPEEVGADVGAIFERFKRERGTVPNMFRTVARRPDHLRTLIDHFRTVMRDGSVPPLLEELICLRVSALNGCRY